MKMYPSLLTFSAKGGGRIKETVVLYEFSISKNGCVLLFQTQFGKRSPKTMLDEINKECEKYHEGLTKAGQSNAELHKAMNLHTVNLKLLSGSLEELQAALPSLEQSGSKSLQCFKLFIHCQKCICISIRSMKFECEHHK